jgi:hypothetical protein
VRGVFSGERLCLTHHGEGWPWHLAEEADQPLDILGSRRQEELLAYKLHPAQAQATESDLILEFRKERLYLSSLSLRVAKGWSVD